MAAVQPYGRSNALSATDSLGKDDDFVMLTMGISEEMDIKRETEAHPDTPPPGFFRRCLRGAAAAAGYVGGRVAEGATYVRETRGGQLVAYAGGRAAEGAAAAIDYAKETRVGKAVTYVAGSVVSTGTGIVCAGGTRALEMAKWAGERASCAAIELAVRNADGKDAEFRAQLLELTGSEELAQAIEAAAPAAFRGILYALEQAAKPAETVPEKMAAWARAKRNEGLMYVVNAFIGCDKGSLSKFIKSAMLRAAANIMRGTHDARNPTQPPLLRILNWFSQNAGSEFGQKLSAIFRTDLDENAQFYAIQALFTDSKLVEKLMDLAFPGGDLGLAAGANYTLWKVLQSYLPGIFTQLIQEYVFLKAVPEFERKERASTGQREEKIRAEAGHSGAVKVEHGQIENELSMALYDREPFARRMRASNLSPADIETAIAAKRDQEGSEAGRLTLWNETGVTHKIKHLEKIFNISSEAIIKLAKEFLGKDDNAAVLLEVLHREYAINPLFHKWLGNQLKLLVNSDDPLALDIWANAEGYLAEMLFTMAANAIEKIARDVGPEEHRESGMVSRLLMQLAKNFKDHDGKVSFEELSGELMGLTEGVSAHRHPLHAVPISPAFRDLLWNLLKTQLLPKVALPYLQKWFSQRDIKSLSEELDGMFLLDEPGGVSGVTKACQAIGDFVSEFTPQYLAKESDTVAQMLMELDLVKAGLIHLNPEDKQNLQDFIKNMLVQFGTNEDPNIKHLFQQVGQYVQAMTMNVVGQAAKKIELIEKDQPKFLVKAINNALKIMEKHFEMIKRENNVPGVGGSLHPALNLDPAISKEERIKNEMDNFYIPFTAKLLKFAGVEKATDLSIPAAIFEQLKSAKGPELMRMMVEKMMDRHTINTMLIKVIEPLNNVVEDLAAHDANELERAAEAVTPEQKALNEACGNAVKALVNMLPGTYAKVFFKIKAIQDLSAAVIGKYVMDSVGASSILEMINELCSGISQEKIAVQEHVVTEAEKLRTENELKFVGVKLVSQKIDEFTRNFFTGLWTRFQKWLEGAFLKLFGPKGLEVKKVLDAIFGFIFFTCIGTVVSYLWEATLYRLFNYMIKAYLTYHSHGFVDMVHLDAHKSAVFHILDSLANDLEGAANAPKVREEFALHTLRRAMDQGQKGDPVAVRKETAAGLTKRLIPAPKPVRHVRFADLPDPATLPIPTEGE